MSYRRKSRNKGNQTHVKNYDFHNRQQVNNPLIISGTLKNLLLRITDMGNDIIAKRILDDSEKKGIPTRLSWLNLTNSNEFISYTIPDKVKKPEDAWNIKNRQATEIKKLIRKIYKKEFSNSQMQSFISKFRKVYSDLKSEKKYTQKEDEKIFTNDKIINNLISQTEIGELEWDLVYENERYEKYSAKIFISDYKSILIELYNMGKHSFLTLNIINDLLNKRNFIKNIQDPDGIWILLDTIKKQYGI